MEGLHILANFYKCQFDLTQEKSLFAQVEQFCSDSGLTVVGKSVHYFEPQGVTFAILLSESHVSIHTWPENGSVAFDVYTCNYQNNNNGKALSVYEKVKGLLQAKEINEKIVERESLRKIKE